MLAKLIANSKTARSIILKAMSLSRDLIIYERIEQDVGVVAASEKYYLMHFNLSGKKPAAVAMLKSGEGKKDIYSPLEITLIHEIRHFLQEISVELHVSQNEKPMH